MAHEVEQMACANEVPWHGLGFKIDANASIEEWQKAAGLNWAVRKAVVKYTADGHAGTNIFKDRFVLYRDTDAKAMAVVAGRYKPVQPKEILEFYRDLIDMHGMKIETAGSLREGKRVWALAKTGNVHKVLGRDSVEGYLLLATSYDATFATLAQFTSVRVVCANTLALSMARGNARVNARVSIPHVREFDPETVKKEMGIGKDAWEAFRVATDTLAKAKIDDLTAKKFVHDLFKIDLSMLPEDMTPAQAVEKKHVDNVLAAYMGDSASQLLAGRTAWGLVNAVTGYVDHGKRARGQEGRLNSAWFGDGASLKNEAFEQALVLVGA